MEANSKISEKEDKESNGDEENLENEGNSLNQDLGKSKENDKVKKNEGKNHKKHHHKDKGEKKEKKESSRHHHSHSKHKKDHDSINQSDNHLSDSNENKSELTNQIPDLASPLEDNQNQESSNLDNSQNQDLDNSTNKISNNEIEVNNKGIISEISILNDQNNNNNNNEKENLGLNPEEKPNIQNNQSIDNKFEIQVSEQIITYQRPEWVFPITKIQRCHDTEIFNELNQTYSLVNVTNAVRSQK